MPRMSYRDAGVDIDAGNALVERIKPLVAETFTSGVLGGIGGFGGLFKPDIAGMTEPVLVSGTDGVGTKLRVAFAVRRHDTIGIDLVAMCVNDVLVCGARPLFFLDYLACGRLDVDTAADVVAGVAAGCKEAGCALIGGETAEMPGSYPPGEYDLAGFAVGLVDRPRLIDGGKVRAGDKVIGLASSGLHSNGFSLARKIFFEAGGLKASDTVAGLTGSIGDALLTPTRIYVRPVLALIERCEVRALAHITGGGLTENLPRVLPDGLSVRVDRGAWRPPVVFERIREMGEVAEAELFRTFNMGIGMCAVVPGTQADAALETLKAAGEAPVVIGEVIQGAGEVVYA